MKQITIAILMAFFVTLQVFAERVDMREAGADSQEALKSTEIINNMIDRLNKAGEGALFLPSGDYLTASIHVKSSITLELEAGATLHFSDSSDDYMPFVEIRYEGVMMKSFQLLIYAADAENITIRGEGKPDGQGKAWWKEFFRVLIDLHDNGKHGINKYQPLFEQANDMKTLYAETSVNWRSTLDRRFLHPPFIQLLCYRNVRMKGIAVMNSPFWTINPNFCDNVTVKGITINSIPSPNIDGINPESCSSVHISDYHVSVGDDCITTKSGRDLQAREVGRPCESVAITNYTMLSGHGGAVIGGEMSGDVKKVTISSCVFDGADRGIRIKSTRGRGDAVEDIRVSNVVMSDIKREAVVLNLKYSQMKMEGKSERTPVFRNTFVIGLTVYGIQIPLRVNGLPETPIEGIVFKNVYVNDAKEECLFRGCKDLVIDDVHVNGEKMKYER